MQIKIEIDVRPEELRRFIGLPDVAGLQDDVVQFVREKLHQAGENFDAGAFVKSNLRLLSRSPLLGKLFTPGKSKSGDEVDADMTDAAVVSAAEARDASDSSGEVAPSSSGTARKAARKPRKAASKRKAVGKRTRKTKPTSV